MSPIDWACATCGHNWDDHRHFVPEVGCRCGSCGDFIPIPCEHGHDPEDNEGPPCTCQEWVWKEKEKP